MYIRGRQCLMLGAALLAASCGSGNGEQNSNGPNIAPIQTVTINQDTTAVVPLRITDPTAPVSSLKITATAADGSLVVPQGISLTNSDANGPTLAITPLESAVGSTQINIMVTDASGAGAQQSFQLIVNAVKVSFTTFATEVLATPENGVPLAVNGVTFIQDADDSTQFDALFN